MDEHETISRREAVIGLGLLGVLSMALVATIMFRIVHSAPRSATQPGAPTWAAAPAMQPGPSAPGSTPLEDALAPVLGDRYAAQSLAPEFPPAAAIPTTADGSSSVPATSLAPAFVPVQEASQISGPPLVEPLIADPKQSEGARPRFLAPSGR